MRQTTYKKRRRSKTGCGAGLWIFILFLASVIFLASYALKQYNGMSLSEKIRRNQYPLKYQHFVEKYSEEYNLDKWLVYAVIRTESRFDVYAVSSANAKGLMQLTEDTGSDCATKLNVRGYKSDMLFDPETNIRFGCYYLHRLMNKYGNTETALASYNGGPGNVDSWLKDSRYSQGGRLTNIPFAETRSYVKKVSDSRDMYKSLYDTNNINAE